MLINTRFKRGTSIVIIDGVIFAANTTNPLGIVVTSSYGHSLVTGGFRVWGNGGNGPYRGEDASLVLTVPAEFNLRVTNISFSGNASYTDGTSGQCYANIRNAVGTTLFSAASGTHVVNAAGAKTIRFQTSRYNGSATGFRDNYWPLNNVVIKGVLE